jgi:hypothetical protein
MHIKTHLLNRRIRTCFLLTGGTALITLAALQVSAQIPDYEMEPISFSTTKPTDVLSQVDIEKAIGPCETDQEFLRKLLVFLKVPVESQVLVYSKTSQQNDAITPTTPRAVYYSDDAYVGWVQHGLVELTLFDPNIGLVFYTLDPRKGHTKELERPQNCLTCHAGSRTHNWPGMMVRSVYVDDDGHPLLANGSFLTGHDSPLEERWGGWYVTGLHGSDYHMGNVIAKETDEGIVLNRNEGANVESLESYFEISPYLLKTSDIVSLMVLEHQVNIHNVLVRANLIVRQAQYRQQLLLSQLGEEQKKAYTGSVLSVANSQVDHLLQLLFFCDEMVIGDDGIEGNEAFQEAFKKNSHANADEKSLKDFNLRERLFKYRCSYMIYSKAFDALPRGVKDILYERMYHILHDEEPVEEYEHLKGWEREFISEILIETKPDIAKAWAKLAAAE